MRSSESFTLEGLAGRRVIVLGAGREGRAAVDALRGTAAAIVATTDAAAPPDWPADVPVLVAPSPERLLAADPAADVAVKSPGIPPHHPLVAALAAAGLPITSGTDLWLGEHAGTTIGVTGSKGKSTTSSLAHALLPGSGFGGNIGLPLLAMDAAPQYVVELSSYQCQSLTVSPDVAVVTSLFPEHLDWHGGLEAYYTDKLNVLRHSPRVVVANGENADVVAWVSRFVPPSSVTWVGIRPDGSPAAYRLEARDGVDWIAREVMPGGEVEFVLPVHELQVLGRHNALNAALALAAADAASVRAVPGRGAGERVPAADAAARLEAFRPLPHRLQPIDDPRGEIAFVNDSLSTTPFAAIEALKAFPDRGAVLLVGGQDRGVDYAPLAAQLAAHPIRAVVGLPPSGERILAEIAAASGVETQLANDLPDAVGRAIALGATSVLLSPAAPSYGAYRDYADRAEHFIRTIQELRAPTEETR
ncbi:UDP-N-acetylmuramoyl-L-alanine--D-glutamate ligase [Galbitalea sp. SE-J8]|uniref:UDP-N-acetylmuramoyl-L-alanine--D-glutamate ligase n=1 Tax=Galbitalea sp. SE-J8 TaxID=3054952 RepID=UPI00259CFCA8|nr:UDP-N-acetylmuramoyl-L-alanine--D-glutamate ligase [Galbitalea sp. SE-J8]MDM4763553.1 UDP-N-acetylmuramoyl-L-alanine--D-glutamate ligase [Galbitalea sp. SE-J8]